MNKLIISAIVLALTSFATISNATPSGKVAQGITIRQEQEKVEIAVKDLPEAVRNALASDTYKDWQVSKAFVVSGENNTKYYQIDLTKGEEAVSVNLDKEGKTIL